MALPWPGEGVSLGCDLGTLFVVHPKNVLTAARSRLSQGQEEQVLSYKNLGFPFSPWPSSRVAASTGIFCPFLEAPKCPKDHSPAGAPHQCGLSTPRVIQLLTPLQGEACFMGYAGLVCASSQQDRL